MAMPGIDVLVDATPLGMKPGDPCVVDPSCIGERHTVLDVVYGHGETALIAACRACGARYQDGLGLLVEQAIATMRIFEVAQGVSLDIDREAIYAAIADAS